jgi:hypothetical protein
MAKVRRRVRHTDAGAILWVALGAVAGLAAGMAIADRMGGLERLTRPNGARRTPRRRDEDGWRGDERRSQHFDALPDDDSELAPEAISHLHLRGRYPEAAAPIPPRRQARPVHDAPTRPATSAGLRRPTADELEARVLEVFRNDPTLAARSVDIGVEQPGVVELTGWVDAADEVEYALTLARGVPDVHEVRHTLLVRPHAAN